MSGPGLVRLWLLPECCADAFAAGLGGTRLLTDAERARMLRLRGGGARRRYLAARLLSRYALSAYTGRPLDRWRFRPGPFGRPEPEPAGDGVRFNLSHTAGLVVCVVAPDGRACGVDVERTPFSPDAARHLVRHFAAAERAELEGLGPGSRAARTGELWVLKEAYLKALGTGVTRSLDGFSFRTAAGGRVVVEDRERPADEGSRWWFDLLRPAPGYVLAVAAEGGSPADLHRTDLSTHDPDIPHSEGRLSHVC
ncbi:4'-phosphopantetheinyl transferase superfamily protein [Streptomyces sp. TRM 70351]|uniref:4'-phosphopantetheinyl transferase family protein n=1 Tax=Streptomyces sp. TRM 70351 TaxID=3116552 RepID=UPI002E7AFF00|nr:4'-phosphopantetheinyl transferase superfamily protein [Streptomyces sp. TRM 70351]MEE1931392.1 4'-phosphopantetheinyl transferase superfamily protein [Streptomyces sp. TRM 70351]